MRKRCPTIFYFSLSIALANLGSAQQLATLQQPVSRQQPVPLQQSASSGAGQDTYTLQTNIQAVVLDVVVTNEKGEVVPNLKKDDFQVYEDKVPQIIQTLEAPPSPAAVAANPNIDSTAQLDRIEPDAPVTLIVLDEINAGFQDEAFARYSLKKFLDKQGDKLDQPTLLGAVDMNHFTLLHDYTTSKKELLSALEHHLVTYPWHMEGESWKAEQFNASFAALMELAKATSGHPGHKSLLWVGRGFPPFDPAVLAPEQADALEQIIEACTNALRDARVTLYTLDPAGVSMEPPTESPDGFDPFSGMLDFNVMAKATGGHAFFGRNDVDKLIEVSARDGANFYTLSYTPTIPRTDTRTFHSIRVLMKNPDWRAETREGYYSLTPLTPGAPSVAGKQPDQQTFDLAVAAQSMMVYDAVHIAVKRVAEGSDQFKISLDSADLVWQESGSHKLVTKITVVAETFNKKGTVLDRVVKFSTLQVGEGSVADIPDAATVDLFTSIPTKSTVAAVRFLIRADANQKLGSVDYDLDSKGSAGEVSN